MTARVSLVVAVGLILGVTGTSSAQIGGWASVNATYFTPAATTTTQTDSFRCCSPSFFGNFESEVVYDTPAALSFDIGGGIRVFRQLGFGVAFSRYQKDAEGQISFSVPHPLFVGRPATASGPTQTQMKQSEQAVHLEARYIANFPHASIAVFAGPSYLQATRELVDNFRFTEALGSQTLNYTVTLTGNTSREFKVKQWGFNIGADGGYYFSDNLGVGGMLRYSKASSDLANPLSDSTEPFDLGGLSIGGGIRFRF